MKEHKNKKLKSNKKLLEPDLIKISGGQLVTKDMLKHHGGGTRPVRRDR